MTRWDPHVLLFIFSSLSHLPTLHRSHDLCLGGRNGFRGQVDSVAVEPYLVRGGVGGEVVAVDEDIEGRAGGEERGGRLCGGHDLHMGEYMNWVIMRRDLVYINKEVSLVYSSYITQYGYHECILSVIVGARTGMNHGIHPLTNL